MAKKRAGGKRKPIITNHNEEKRPWSNLPSEILEMIKKKLIFIDQVKFNIVCTSWHSIKRIQPLKQFPWLLVFQNDSPDSYKLVDSNDQKAYEIDLKAIKDKLKIIYLNQLIIHTSKYGWLLVSNHYTDCGNPRLSTPTLILYSPFYNKNFIELPMLNDRFSYATFTCNPIEENCKILTLLINDEDSTLIINTYRLDIKSWSRQIFKCGYRSWDIKCWMYSEENFYYVTSNNGETGKFDLRREEWNTLPTIPKMLGLSYLPHHLVKSSDGVLFSILECNLMPRHDIWQNHSHIHRLDLSSMVWEDLDSIGDHVLFIGEGYHAILDSSGLKLKRGSISDRIYWCIKEQLKYCNVHHYTAEVRERGKLRKSDCSKHFGPIAKKRCRKMLIDPPPR